MHLLKKCLSSVTKSLNNQARKNPQFFGFQYFYKCVNLCCVWRWKMPKDLLQSNIPRMLCLYKFTLLFKKWRKIKWTSFWMPKNISFLKSLQMSSGGKVSCLLPIRLGFCWKHTPIPKKEICKILQLELFLRGAKIIQLLLAMADFCGRVLKKKKQRRNHHNYKS